MLSVFYRSPIKLTSFHSSIFFILHYKPLWDLKNIYLTSSDNSYLFFFFILCLLAFHYAIGLYSTSYIFVLLCTFCFCTLYIYFLCHRTVPLSNRFAFQLSFWSLLIQLTVPLVRTSFRSFLLFSFFRFWLLSHWTVPPFLDFL